MKRQLAEKSGRDGERRAALWLRAKGWRILDSRVKTPAGEIDLVAKRGGVVAFVEVKWRKRAADLDFAIDEYRLSRVAAAVEVLPVVRGFRFPPAAFFVVAAVEPLPGFADALPFFVGVMGLPPRRTMRQSLREPECRWNASR